MKRKGPYSPICSKYLFSLPSDSTIKISNLSFGANILVPIGNILAILRLFHLFVSL